MGLANRLVEPGAALAAALDARRTSSPRSRRRCLRSDRLSSYEQWDLPLDEALPNEYRLGLAALASGETLEGAPLRRPAPAVTAASRR